MNPKKSVFKTALELLLLAMLVFGLAAVLRVFLEGTPGLPAGQVETVSPPPEETAPVAQATLPTPDLIIPTPGAYPLPEEALQAIETATAAPYPTPMLDVTVEYAITTPLATETARPTPTSTPTPLPPFPETPPIMEGQAATLYQGDIWLVEPGRQAEALTASGDVTAIFGWNRDGSKLLFRRGSNSQSGLEGGTTQLWLLDMNTRKANRLVSGDGVKSASWSPMDDRIVYCTRSDVLSIITLDEVLLYQLKQVLCDFTWSPDGSRIAIETYTPDMIDSDGLKYTVLGVWWPAEDRLQVFSDAKDEVHYSPVWSMDGTRILFERSYLAPDKQELSGLHVLVVASGQIQRIEKEKSSFKLEIRRSPRADLVAYRMDGGIYMTDFEGQSKLIDQGNAPLWLPDGKTLLYRAVDASFRTFSVEAQVAKSPAGGDQPATGVIIDPEYYPLPGGEP